MTNFPLLKMVYVIVICHVSVKYRSESGLQKIMLCFFYGSHCMYHTQQEDDAVQ
jgi:hypothetical protein